MVGRNGTWGFNRRCKRLHVPTMAAPAGDGGGPPSGSAASRENRRVMETLHIQCVYRVVLLWPFLAPPPGSSWPPRRRYPGAAPGSYLPICFDFSMFQPWYIMFEVETSGLNRRCKRLYVPTRVVPAGVGWLVNNYAFTKFSLMLEPRYLQDMFSYIKRILQLVNLDMLYVWDCSVWV